MFLSRLVRRSLLVACILAVALIVIYAIVLRQRVFFLVDAGRPEAEALARYALEPFRTPFDRYTPTVKTDGSRLGQGAPATKESCELLRGNEARYAQAVKLRREKMMSRGVKFKWSLFDETTKAWRCPDLQQYGHAGHDKWICGFTSVGERPCIVHSFGSFGMVQFEEAISIKHPGCVIHTFDPTLDRLKLWLGTFHVGKYQFPAAVNYHYIGIGDNPGTFSGNTGSRSVDFQIDSLSNIMERLGHPYVDVLKMDVEGSEWSTVDALMRGNTLSRVGHILMEIHLAGSISPEREWPDVVRMVEQLEDAGFRLVKQAPAWSNDRLHEKIDGPDLTEMSFVNKNWVGDLKMRNDGCWANDGSLR